MSFSSLNKGQWDIKIPIFFTLLKSFKVVVSLNKFFSILCKKRGLYKNLMNYYDFKCDAKHEVINDPLHDP